MGTVTFAGVEIIMKYITVQYNVQGVPNFRHPYYYVHNPCPIKSVDGQFS